MIGLNVMLNQLSMNLSGSHAALEKAWGQKITKLTLGDDDALHFVFENGYKLRISDEGQFCCEHRYMRTDDNLDDFIGAELLSVMVKEGPDDYIESEGVAHEIQFLEIETSEGEFTMVSHNEYSGYYGGFSVVASEE